MGTGSPLPILTPPAPAEIFAVSLGIELTLEIDKTCEMRAVLVASLLGTGCLFTATTLHGGALRSRASYELQCPEKQLQITELGDNTAGVDGCGRRATYVYNGEASAWLLNSPISR